MGESCSFSKHAIARTVLRRPKRSPPSLTEQKIELDDPQRRYELVSPPPHSCGYATALLIERMRVMVKAQGSITSVPS